MKGAETEDLLPGLKVVEVATFAAGPTVGAILADFGADVIHIEDPVLGDPYRAFVSQAWISSGVDASFNASWELVNRNKRSASLDLKSEAGQGAFRRLIAQADVFVTNLLIDSRRRIGIDYETLASQNPRLVYVSVTGYGSHGPWAERRGYDFSAFWAASGMMGMFAEVVGSAFVSRPGMGDRPSGLIAAGAVGLALYNRERTGKGQAIDISLLHTGLWTVGADVQRVAALGAPLPYDQRVGPENPLWNPYPTADGKWIMLALHPNFDFDRVCRALGDQQLREDPRFGTAELRKSHSREMVETLDRIFRTRTRDEWDKRFQEADLIWAPVMMPQEIIETEQGREAFFDAEHPAVGRYRLLRSPINFSRTPGKFRRRAPDHGEHTVEVLREVGMTPAEIERVTNSAK